MTSRIEYLKKKDKKASIKAVKNEAIRGDATYKSSTISVATGEPATSGMSPPPPNRGSLIIVSSPQPPRMPKRKKAAKKAPAGMAVSLSLV